MILEHDAAHPRGLGNLGQFQDVDLARRAIRIAVGVNIDDALQLGHAHPGENQKQ